MTKRFEGWIIDTGFLGGNLFNDTTGIDVPASCANYARALRAALEAEFPGAKVEIDYEENAEGVSPKTHAYSMHSELNVADGYDEQIAEQVDNICTTVWNNMESWVVNELTAEEIETLGTMTNRDEAGTHFTQKYSAELLDKLERLGYITIDRPVHETTGLAYSQEYWTLEATEKASKLF